MAAAFPNAYTDVSITSRGPYNQTGQNDIAETTNNPSQVNVYDVAGRDDGPFPARAAPPGNPNSWVAGRDVYKNDGVVGQDFFKNQG